MLCIAGGIRNAGGYVWAYNTQPFFQDKGYSPDTIASFMSVIPLVAGSLGAVVGGLISDVLVKGRGPYARIWVLIVSQVRAGLMSVCVQAMYIVYPFSLSLSFSFFLPPSLSLSLLPSSLSLPPSLSLSSSLPLSLFLPPSSC